MNSYMPKRETILNRLNSNKDKNMFCKIADLTNEASVESFFISKLLEDLGYKPDNIKPKVSIKQEKMANGAKSYYYKPDYVIHKNNVDLLVIDAKSTKEHIEDYVEQCVHYCIILNRDHRTIRFFMLSNGIKTALYSLESSVPVLELAFWDFEVGNEKYEKLRKFINLSALIDTNTVSSTEKYITIKRVNKEEAQKVFLSCHKYIWSTEKRGPLSAFTEFVKLIFVKLWNDKVLNDKYEKLPNGDLKVDEESNTFSVKWIESREDEIISPVSSVLFKNLLDRIQDDIEQNHKKTIFDKDEKINLKPTTIKGVAKKLERLNLFGIDEDLNGRLFETFLNSTMRGEALGQYFTPRSIVLLGTLLADLQVSDTHIDKVIDASCGTGGFLIEALTIMRNKVRLNQSLSHHEKEVLINKIANESMFGIDAAADPNLSRIARINMYLHGDGGSHIYFNDGLAKKIEIDKFDDRLLQSETLDMISKIREKEFDVVLTNPPFSMWYENANEVQRDILKEYELLKIEGTKKIRNRLRGSEMFIERYSGLLKPGGKLISIIDDTVLSSSDYSYFRDFIRKNFIIKAIISLHGDAFQMSKARVKTALIYLIKKENQDDQQTAAFMYSSIYLGVDDMPLTSPPEFVKKAREKAKLEIEHIISCFDLFKSGAKDFWYIPFNRLHDRLDVKSCVPLFGRYIDKWLSDGYDVKSLEDLFTIREEIIYPKSKFPTDHFNILTITYSGECQSSEVRLGKEINFSKMLIVREGDIVFSEYNTYHGAIGYVTKEHDGSLASSSYTVVRCNVPKISIYLWSIMRTTEIRADFLSSAIGMGRQTICWDTISKVRIPLLKTEEMERISISIQNAWDSIKKSNLAITQVFNDLNGKFDVESDESHNRFEATKPPK